MKRILKHYDKECTMTMEMDYTEYIQLMCYLTSQNSKELVESIENSEFKVEDYTTKD